MSSQIQCNDGKCPLLRKTGDVNHSHDALENFKNEEIDFKNPSSSEYRIFTAIIFILVPFSLAIYFPIDVHVSLVNVAMFYSGILTASATIFAISFTVSYFLISRVADSYSPYIIKLYRDSQTGKASFFGLLITTVVSAMFLGIDFSPFEVYFYNIGFSGDEFAKFSVWCTFVLFMVSILIFVKHFIVMMDVIEPIKFSFLIKQLAMKKLKNGDFAEFNNMIISMGDIITKSEESGQTRIANQFQKQLDTIFEDIISK